MESKLIWGSVAGKSSKAPRRRALKLADTGKVYEPVTKGSGMHQEVEEKVAATFLSGAELRAQLDAEQSDGPATQAG